MTTSTAPSVAYPLAVVVLTRNRRDDLIDCLEAVRAFDVPDLRLFVVDNGSTDDTAEVVASDFPEATLLREPENLGAPGGRNVGWKHAVVTGRPQYVLFLDDDAVADPALARTMVQRLEDDLETAVVCGKGYGARPSRTVLSAGMICNLYTGVVRDIGTGEADRGQYDAVKEVDACSGFAFMVRTEVLEATGGLDEAFFPYGWEDTEFCLRVRKLGYRVIYEPAAVAWHKGCEFGRGRVARFERSKARNYLRMLHLHTSPWQKAALAVCLPWRVAHLFVRMLARGQLGMIRFQLRGVFEGLAQTLRRRPAKEMDE